MFLTDAGYCQFRSDRLSSPNVKPERTRQRIDAEMPPVNVPAVLLVGGKGTRLQAVLPSTPKPLAPVGDIPFLELLVMQLRLQGIPDGFEYRLSRRSDRSDIRQRRSMEFEHSNIRRNRDRWERRAQ